MELFWMIVRSFFEVLAVGALLGAGLPALFAGGVRMLAWSDGAIADRAGAGVPQRVGKVLAYAIFALVVLLVLLGIAVIVASGLGVTLHFEGIVPILTR